MDILAAGARIEKYLHGLSFADYEENDLIRNAVERCFEMIGEALTQLRKFHPDYVLEITSEQQIINFRNRVIHGYFGVEDAVVWSIAKAQLPGLLAEVRLRLDALQA